MSSFFCYSRSVLLSATFVPCEYYERDSLLKGGAGWLDEVGEKAMVGENFDISLGHHETSSSPGRAESGGEADSESEAAAGRRFIGVRFRCCGTYARAYLNKAGTTYQGNCPKCSKPIRFKVGPGGTDSRFFEVY